MSIRTNPVMIKSRIVINVCFLDIVLDCVLHHIILFKNVYIRLILKIIRYVFFRDFFFNHMM